tara:strand:+ start:2105 stop:2662 length:558 start_codon:yes stop_codon:yes gene_type:complete
MNKDDESKINPVVAEMVEDCHITAFSWEQVSILPTGEVVSGVPSPKNSTQVIRIHILGELIAQYSFYRPENGDKKSWLQSRGRLKEVKLTDDDWMYLGAVAAAGMFFQEIRTWLRTEVDEPDSHLPARKNFGFRVKPRGHVTQLLRSKAWLDLVQEYAEKGLKLKCPDGFGGFTLVVSRPPVLVD